MVLKLAVIWAGLALGNIVYEYIRDGYLDRKSFETTFFQGVALLVAGIILTVLP